MKFRDYLSDHIFSVMCLIVSELLIYALLWLIGTEKIFVVFSESIVLFAYAASFIWDYSRKHTWYYQILTMLDKLDEKTLLGEIAVQPHFWDGEILLEILRRCNKYQNDQLADFTQQNIEYREYLDSWVHEIKTPITSARLLVENNKNLTTLRIDDELRKIDGYVEQVLYYARSTDVEKDFRVERTTFRAIVNIALKNYSKQLIHSGGKLYMDGLDIDVCADTKSCAFIIGQLVSNAIKYRKENFELRFTVQKAENSIQLRIVDNGIGIPVTDLSRIFDKGFTGENGRRFPKSTGIGLYLCKKLCGKMNIGLSVDSVQGEGTTVSMDFPTESFLRGAGE